MLRINFTPPSKLDYLENLTIYKTNISDISF